MRLPASWFALALGLGLATAHATSSPDLYRQVQRAKGQQQRDLAKRAMPCSDPCTDAAALAANQAVATQREKLIAEELVLRDALFKDWQEVELLFSLTELAALRTDAFSRNAGDAMPDALSGATRNSKTP